MGWFLALSHILALIQDVFDTFRNRQKRIDIEEAVSGRIAKQAISKAKHAQILRMGERRRLRNNSDRLREDDGFKGL